MSSIGIFGEVVSYIGVIESQNRGTLHLHMLLWLKNTPPADEMRCVPGMTSQTLKAIKREADLAYTRPPHPDDPEFERKFENLKIRLVRSQQIHTCKRRACLQWDYKTMSWKCKRRAPFPLSESDVVDEKGNWNPMETQQ